MGLTNVFALCAVLLAVAFQISAAEICAGCPVNQDVSDPKYMQAVQMALSSENSNDKPGKIISVTTQVVAGIKTTIVFEAIDEHTNAVKECTTVLINQAWVSDKPQVVSFKCNNVRKTRSIPGGLKDIDTNSESDLVKLLGNMAADTLDRVDTDNYKRAVVDVLEAKKQIVNGIMYHLKLVIKTTSCQEGVDTNDDCLSKEAGPRKICKVKFYRSFADKAPLDIRVVSSECDDAATTTNFVATPEEISTDSQEVKNVVGVAVDRVNLMINSPYKHALVNVLSATKQLVAGYKYVLKISMARTDCMKNDHSDRTCNVVNGESMVCDVSILEQPWKHTKNVLSAKCGDNRQKRSIGGGISPVDVNDKSIADLHDYISTELTSRANSLYTKKVVKVYNATTQVVSGSMTRVTVEVADTNCLKSENKPISECNASQQGRQICKIAIWDQPWINRREMTQSECHSMEKTPERRKRGIHITGHPGPDKELNEFYQFVTKYGKVYHSVDEMVRRSRIYRGNMLKAAYLQKTEQGTGIYGPTIFADLTSAEFKKYLGYNHDPNRVTNLKKAPIPNITLPESFDWRDHNAVTPVKNQGMCGSCWAFSVTGNIEGQYAIRNQELLSFSEQELVDCDKYDSGCNGGLFDTAYHAIEDLGGLETEKDYPYDARDESCHFNKSESKVTISGGYNVSSDETDMAKFLVQNGPISIAVNANAMQFYMGGVSHPLKFLCNPKNLDHGVLIVGYGVHKGWITRKMLPYWLIKNSWGPGWGSKGYYMLYRGDGSCGVNQMPTQAIIN